MIWHKQGAPAAKIHRHTTRLRAPWAHRRGLSFAQAEGAKELPRQLGLKEISREAKALIWAAFVDSVPAKYPSMGGHAYISDDNWRSVFRNKWILRDHRPADEFENRHDRLMKDLKAEIWSDNYVEVLDCVQWFLNRQVPDKFRARIAWALETSRMAYRVVDRNLIAPAATQVEADALKAALADAASSGIAGARSHLRQAAEHASGGRWADCVREAIHAVEGTAKVLDENAGTTLSPALSSLEQKVDMHANLKAGFVKLYGYTSDEKGVRHALLDQGDAKVDEVDALFMLGACAAFVSYLIGKGRSAGLIP